MIPCFYDSKLVGSEGDISCRGFPVKQQVSVGPPGVSHAGKCLCRPWKGLVVAE